MKHFQKQLIRIVILILLFASPLMLTNYDDSRNFEMAKSLDIFYSLFQELNTHYVDDIPPGDLMNYTIEKMLESLDPYTKYIPESDVEQFQMMTKGEYGGIGAMIGMRDSVMMISEIFEGYAAHKAGLLPGDIIIEVDGRSIIGKSREDIHVLLQGQPGTTLKLGIIRHPSRTITQFAIQRETIEMKNVPYYDIIHNTVGYIKISSFTQNCAKEVKQACIELKQRGATSLILDFRDNPGGLLIEAVQITNLFVEQGKKIVYTKGKNSLASSTFTTREAAYDTKIPLAIVINQNSASASEIVAGALQDLDRAVIIGNQTFGKGLVQTRRELAHNSLLKITTSKYYIPSGRCIQKMDYSQHFSNKSATTTPDSLLNVFYTANKRPVKDGGGIMPDVLVQKDTSALLLTALKKQFVIQDFVYQNYTNADTARIKPISYTIDNNTYDAFIQFAHKQKFVYSSAAQTQLQNIQNQLTKENIQVSHIFDNLQTEIQQQQQNLFITEKKSIVRELESTIITRLYFEKGKIRHELLEDDYIQTAANYLKNEHLYTDILIGKTGVHKKK